VIAIIGTLVALLLPAVNAAREAARNSSCKNNLKQLTLAVIQMDSAGRALPGYVNELADTSSPKSGDPPQHTRANRASWIVMLFPYMEQNALWDEWSGNFSGDLRTPFIEMFTCPSNPPETPDQPWLGYVGNAGWAFSDETRNDLPTAQQTMEFAANGIFFDNNRNKQPAVTPTPDDREGNPAISMKIANIQDGPSKTLILSENVHTWYWAYDEPDIMDTKHIFGFVWSNQPVLGRINAEKYYRSGSMAEFSALENTTDSPPGPPKNETLGYPSSNHAAGVNVSYGDGHVDYMNETIDPRVYGQLMTSNAKRSNLKWDVGDGLQPDRTLPQPSDDEY
jgi:prepilin-type processing-associated H-X9-DG protein